MLTPNELILTGFSQHTDKLSRDRINRRQVLESPGMGRLDQRNVSSKRYWSMAYRAIKTFWDRIWREALRRMKIMTLEEIYGLDCGGNTVLGCRFLVTNTSNGLSGDLKVGRIMTWFKLNKLQIYFFKVVFFFLDNNYKKKIICSLADSQYFWTMKTEGNKCGIPPGDRNKQYKWWCEETEIGNFGSRVENTDKGTSVYCIHVSPFRTESVGKPR